MNFTEYNWQKHGAILSLSTMLVLLFLARSGNKHNRSFTVSLTTTGVFTKLWQTSGLNSTHRNKENFSVDMDYMSENCYVLFEAGPVAQSV